MATPLRNMPLTQVAALLKNPLVTAPKARSGYLRLVLAEAAFYGMPPQIVATLDDLAVMQGFHEPISRGQVGHMAGPLPQWSTHPDQPLLQAIADVENLAYKQRALIAFGGAAPGHMVGTAEILYAMGNVHQDFFEKQGTSPAFQEVWRWAAADVMAALDGIPHASVWREWGMTPITDDEVLRPTGRLYATYETIATYIRRTTISWMEGRPDHPRAWIKPVAQRFLEHHRETLRTEKLEPDIKGIIEDQIRMIETMYPDLRTASAAEPNPA